MILDSRINPPKPNNSLNEVILNLNDGDQSFKIQSKTVVTMLTANNL